VRLKRRCPPHKNEVSKTGPLLKPPIEGRERAAGIPHSGPIPADMPIQASERAVILTIPPRPRRPRVLPRRSFTLQRRAPHRRSYFALSV
jgi:hypothetical protein